MTEKPTAHSKETKDNGALNDWTIMLYIAADNNLANFAVESLKQVNGTAGNGVAVAAQFAVDAPGGQSIPRYIFDKSSKESIKHAIVDSLNAPKNMTEQEALASFLAWVYKDDFHKLKAKNYALIIWGHGPELVFQPPSGQIPNDRCGDPGADHTGLYLSPIELRNALREGIPQKDGQPDPDKKLRIIGMDACSMSFLEVAYEIQDYADYMVASQEEVPDPSFPYNSLVDYFRNAKDVESLCRSVVHDYVLAYQDYICDVDTGMKKVTLSAVRLGKLHKLTQDLKELAKKIDDIVSDPKTPPPPTIQAMEDLLLAAREDAKGFAGGLYVDICSFCQKLDGELGAGNQIPHADDIQMLCRAVCDDLKPDDDPQKPNPDLCILANQATDPSECHGLSIYFPYLDDEQIDDIKEPLVKGGTDIIGKGYTALMNRAASNLLLCIRRQLIIDTEEYYGDLKLSADTKWNVLVQTAWSEILASNLPHELDLRYSAQQAAVNLAN